MSAKDTLPRMTAATSPRDQAAPARSSTTSAERVSRSCSSTGSAARPGNWVEVLPDLVRRHRVIAVDLPGHAGSEPLARGATMDDFAAATAAVLEAESVERRSRRGPLARRSRRAAARAEPAELVRGLLLVAPAGIATTSRIVEALVIAAAAIRPGRAVARFRHRWADRVWYRRARLPAVVRLRSGRADAARDPRAALRPAAAHGHEGRGAGDDRRRSAPRLCRRSPARS